MPMYDYHCNACGHDFEELAKADDETGLACDKCGDTDTKRLPAIPVTRVNDAPKKNPRLPSSFGGHGSSLGGNAHS